MAKLRRAGNRALPSGSSAFYLSFNGVPAEMGLPARAASPRQTSHWRILLGGNPIIDRVGTLEVRSGRMGRSVTQYEISGLSYTPIPIWLDDDGVLRRGFRMGDGDS